MQVTQSHLDDDTVESWHPATAARVPSGQKRAETSGVAVMIAGLCIASRSDDERLARDLVLFDQLQPIFARRKR
jgi:hypothetical protein